ncbi:unnamed protein product, partial [Meganyctiphanes norvegica]
NLPAGCCRYFDYKTKQKTIVKMPVFKIQMSAQLENITNITAPGDDFQYVIKIRCNSCNEVCDKWLYISADESAEIPGSRGNANMVYKCKLCKKTHTLDVLLQHRKPYTIDDVPNFKEIIAFECRGISVVEFKFADGWSCEGSESGTKFEDLCLDEDWCDYDEESNQPVGISELESKIV